MKACTPWRATLWLGGARFDRQNGDMPSRLCPPDPRRRSWLPAALAGLPASAAAAVARLRDVMRRAEAIRDLPGCVLVSTSRPCRMCEATACWTGIARTVYGEALTDAGPPR